MKTSRSKLALALAVALVAGFATPILLSGLYLPSRQPQPSASWTPSGEHSFEIPLQLEEPHGAPSLRTFSTLSELKSFLSTLKERERFSEYLSASSPITTLVATPERAQMKMGAEPAYSKTNIQVEGADEPDLAKTDGRLIATVSGSRVYLVNARERRVESVIEPPLYPRGVYLANNTLIVVCGAPEYRVLSAGEGSIARGPVSALAVYDVSDPARPRLLHNATVTGWFSASRMTGRSVYLVATHSIKEVEIPELDGREVDPRRVVAVSPRADGYINVLALDPATGKRSSLSILTELSGYGWFYMSGERIYAGYSSDPRVEDFYGEFLINTQGLVPSEVYERISSLLAGGNLVDAFEVFLDYASKLSLEELQKLVAQAASRVRISSHVTIFHVFRVSSVDISFLGSFAVPGSVLDQFSIEEHKGFFLVATTRAEWAIKGAVVEGPRVVPPPRQGDLKVVECGEGGCTERVIRLNVTESAPRWRRFYVSLWLEQRGSDNCLFAVRLSDLKVVGNLSGLAPGERVYSSRLVGDTFYLVTFRNVDPLFAIDVSDPSAPRVLGYLKVPGFSEYLHPLPGSLLLGVGWDPDSSSLKVSLFDVSNPAAMREVSSVRLVGAYTPALHDHHAVLVWLSRRLLLIPLSVDSSGGVAVFEIREKGVSLKTLLEHQGALRSLYIGSEIYTVSLERIKVFCADSFRVLAEIPLKS